MCQQQVSTTYRDISPNFPVLPDFRKPCSGCLAVEKLRRCEGQCRQFFCDNCLKLASKRSQDLFCPLCLRNHAKCTYCQQVGEYTHSFLMKELLQLNYQNYDSLLKYSDLVFRCSEATCDGSFHLHCAFPFECFIPYQCLDNFGQQCVKFVCRFHAENATGRCARCFGVYRGQANWTHVMDCYYLCHNCKNAGLQKRQYLFYPEDQTEVALNELV